MKKTNKFINNLSFPCINTGDAKMTLQLTGKSESLPALLGAQLGDEAYQKLQELYGDVDFAGLGLYREFYGEARIQMPLLVSGKNEEGKQIDVPRDPASFC